MTRWASAHLDEIGRRDTWITIREHFGVRALGINAFVGAEAGDEIIHAHAEDWHGHEELYVVLEGHATFTVDGDEIDAPARTIVYVREPSARRGAVAKAPGTTILAAGGEPGAAFEPSPYDAAWQWMQRGTEHYRAGRYAEAAAEMRDGLAELPENSALRYNLACYSALAREPEEALAALRHAVEEDPRFTELARSDPDFASLREDPRFTQLVG